jgi:hypothetical protein
VDDGREAELLAVRTGERTRHLGADEQNDQDVSDAVEVRASPPDGLGAPRQCLDRYSEPVRVHDESASFDPPVDHMCSCPTVRDGLRCSGGRCVR